MGVTRGAAAGTQLYDPCGATRYGGAGVAYQYTGQRNEASLGIYYYGARWYDPSIGRFMQADTIVPNPSNPQSLNRYSYVLNNPLKYTEATGRKPASSKYSLYAVVYVVSACPLLPISSRLPSGSAI
ncbi:MAG: RHS repeat-associated core domain-containing protein [Anaerolineae bacterium]